MEKEAGVSSDSHPEITLRVCEAQQRDAGNGNVRVSALDMDRWNSFPCTMALKKASVESRTS